jgi:hypothetical protein
VSTAAEALAALKSRLSTGISFSVYWQGDAAPILPDTPTAFAYCVFDNEGSGVFPVSFGNGAGGNTYRNRATLNAFTFSPARYGAAAVLGHAETIAARLRSYRDTYISCFAADVILIGPGSQISVPSIGSAVNNYQCAVAEVSLHFDQIG